jgi:hygromycin-B 7''-O-kinase
MLKTQDEYVRLFTDAAFWTPHIEEVCRRHSLNCTGQVRGGLPGTYPTFIASQEWVIKFFGQLFEGEQSFQVEHEAARLLQEVDSLPVPALLGAGELFEQGEGWPWPYLIFEFIPALSLGEAAPPVPPEQMQEAARWMGAVVKDLHGISLRGSQVFPDDWAPFLAFLDRQRRECVQRHRAWGTLPPALIDQIEAYLLPVEELILPRERPHLIHADLTADHLLGSWQDQGWQPLALIDFGDAMTGSLYYELAALHQDMFRGQAGLLKAFLEGYGLEARQEEQFARKALCAALLHRFNMFPSDLEAHTLQELEKTFQVF